MWTFGIIEMEDKQNEGEGERQNIDTQTLLWRLCAYYRHSDIYTGIYLDTDT